MLAVGNHCSSAHLLSQSSVHPQQGWMLACVRRYPIVLVIAFSSNLRGEFAFTRPPLVMLPGQPGIREPASLCAAPDAVSATGTLACGIPRSSSQIEDSAVPDQARGQAHSCPRDSDDSKRMGDHGNVSDQKISSQTKMCVFQANLMISIPLCTPMLPNRRRHRYA